MAIVNIINFMLYTILIVEIILIIYLRKGVISLFNGLLSLFMDLLGKNKEKPEAQKSGYEEVRSYILKELDKGCAYEQISKSLLRVGWKKEMIDLVINEIMKRKQR